MAERSKGGMSTSEGTSSARTRPRAWVSSTSSLGNDGVWASTISRALSTGIPASPPLLHSNGSRQCRFPADVPSSPFDANAVPGPRGTGIRSVVRAMGGSRGSDRGLGRRRRGDDRPAPPARRAGVPAVPAARRSGGRHPEHGHPGRSRDPSGGGAPAAPLPPGVARPSDGAHLAHPHDPRRALRDSRPHLQGARLTAWELMQDGIPTTLIADSMAGHMMARGEVNAVVVGADRIAGNGDVANKIGTYSVAILAKEHGIPFYVAAPVSTFDLATPDGSGIPIEERSPDEVTHHGGRRLAPEGGAVRNPAFHGTPHRYVTAIVCERGGARPPYRESLRALLEGR